MCCSIETRRGATHDDNFTGVPVLPGLVFYVMHRVCFTLSKECALRVLSLLQTRTTPMRQYLPASGLRQKV